MNQDPGQDGGWETVSTETIYPGPHLRLNLERLRSPMRPEPFPWAVVHRKVGAMVAPLTPEGRFVMLRQERPPIRATLWEFPAGQVDGSDSPDGNAIRAAALRELREETGYELSSGGELIPLGYYFSSQGFTDERCYLFLARGAVPSPEGHAHDVGEAIAGVQTFTPQELREMIATNEIRDANTLSAYARMIAMGIAVPGMV